MWHPSVHPSFDKLQENPGPHGRHRGKDAAGLALKVSACRGQLLQDALADQEQVPTELRPELTL